MVGKWHNGGLIGRRLDKKGFSFHKATRRLNRAADSPSRSLLIKMISRAISLNNFIFLITGHSSHERVLILSVPSNNF